MTNTKKLLFSLIILCAPITFVNAMHQRNGSRAAKPPVNRKDKPTIDIQGPSSPKGKVPKAKTPPPKTVNTAVADMIKKAREDAEAARQLNGNVDIVPSQEAIARAQDAPKEQQIRMSLKERSDYKHHMAVLEQIKINREKNGNGSGPSPKPANADEPLLRKPSPSPTKPKDEPKPNPDADKDKPGSGDADKEDPSKKNPDADKDNLGTGSGAKPGDDSLLKKKPTGTGTGSMLSGVNSTAYLVLAGSAALIGVVYKYQEQIKTKIWGKHLNKPWLKPLEQLANSLTKEQWDREGVCKLLVEALHNPQILIQKENDYFVSILNEDQKKLVTQITYINNNVSIAKYLYDSFMNMLNFRSTKK